MQGTGGGNAIIVGFNVAVEQAATDLALRGGVEIKAFSIIYELAEWLREALAARTPVEKTEERTGRAKVLKTFSTQKNTQVLGGRMEEGALRVGDIVKVMRRDLEIGRGKIQNLQQQKANVETVATDEFGMQVSSNAEVAPGDFLEAFSSGAVK